MRYIFIVFLFTYSLFANDRDRSGLGIGAIISESKYEGIDRQTRVIPLFRYNSDTFYVRGIEIGYKQIDTKPFKLNYILSPRLEELDSSDSTYLSGMEDRDMTLEAGVSIRVNVIPLVTLSARAKMDTLGVHKGYDIGYGISLFLPISKTFFISPSYQKINLSSNLADYYNGVKSSEATTTREAYSVSSTTVDRVGINFIYKLSKDINTNLMISQTRLSEELKGSPIIKDKDFTSAIMGISYLF